MSIIKNIANKLGESLCNATNGTNKDKEVYIYFFKRFTNYIVFITNLIVIFIIIKFINIGNSTDIILSIISTYIITSLLRSRFGGLHVENDYLCLVLTLIFSTVNGIIASILNLNIYIIMVNYFISLFIIITNNVVDSKNRRLSEKKKKYFKKQGGVIFALLIIINLIFPNKLITNSIFIGLINNNINILLGNYKNRRVT